MRTILVFGDKNFKIVIPDEARLTFSPWSPPPRNGGWDNGEKAGTLRVYAGAGEKNVLACFSGVRGFRDTCLSYAEEVFRETGSAIWRDDEKGLVKDEHVSQQKGWIVPELRELPASPDSEQ